MYMEFLLIFYGFAVISMDVLLISVEFQNMLVRDAMLALHTQNWSLGGRVTGGFLGFLDSAQYSKFLTMSVLIVSAHCTESNI